MSKNFCGDCDFNRNGLCIVHRWDVSKESPICSVYRKTYPGTVFQKITVSPETLAGVLVHPKGEKLCCIGADHRYEYKMTWGSVLLPGVTFEEYAEPYLLTVSKLKEVNNDEK